MRRIVCSLVAKSRHRKTEICKPDPLGLSGSESKALLDAIPLHGLQWT
jgi:hypothetical protein